MRNSKKILVATILVVLWVAFVLGLIGLINWIIPMTGVFESVFTMLKIVFAGFIPGYLYIDFLLDMAADSDVLYNN